MTVVLILSVGIVTGAALSSPAPRPTASICPGAKAVKPAVVAAIEDGTGVTATPTGSLPAQLVAQPTRLKLVPVFEQWAQVCGLPAALVEATCWWESGWQESAVSVTGAVGICQIEPNTVVAARALLGDETLDPRSVSDNIEMSAAYLRWLLDQTGGNRAQALAGYYQGITSLREHGILAVSRPYVAGISALLEQYRWS
jgi:soluble lytic murein transglycosylase-like protein